VPRVGEVNVGMMTTLSLALMGMSIGLALRVWARRLRARRIH